MKRWLPLVAILSFFAYPFLVHWLTSRGWDGVIVGLMAAILMWRGFGEAHRFWRLLWFVSALILLGGALWLDAVVVRWVPAATFALLAWVFGRTLVSPPSLIERMVRLQFHNIPTYLSVYTRRLTWVWTVFFALAALVSVILTVLRLESVWLWFHGIGIYLGMGLLLGGEYLYRGWRFPELDRTPPPYETFREIIRHGKHFWQN